MPARKNGGFTLIEVIIVIALSLILLMLGIPAYANFRAEQGVKAAAGGLQSDFRLAQSKALASEHRIYVIFRPEGINVNYYMIEDVDDDGDYSDNWGRGQGLIKKVDISSFYTSSFNNISSEKRLVFGYGGKIELPSGSESATSGQTDIDFDDMSSGNPSHTFTLTGSNASVYGVRIYKTGKVTIARQ